MCFFSPSFLLSLGLFCITSCFSFCLSICPTWWIHFLSFPTLPWVPRKVTFMDDIKELPYFLTSAWFCSMEETSKKLNSGKTVTLGRLLFPFSPVGLHGSSLAMQSTACISVTWPLYVILWEFQAQKTAQMLILWLLLLLWVTNCPLSLTQEFCVFCQHPWIYSGIACKLSKNSGRSWHSGVLH